MSLFIGGLAFEHTGGDAETYLMSHRLGILSGSLIAGITGYLLLLLAKPAGERGGPPSSAMGSIDQDFSFGPEPNEEPERDAPRSELR